MIVITEAYETPRAMTVNIFFCRPKSKKNQTSFVEINFDQAINLFNFHEAKKITIFMLKC